MCFQRNLEFGFPRKLIKAKTVSLHIVYEIDVNGNFANVGQFSVFENITFTHGMRSLSVPPQFELLLFFAQGADIIENRGSSK